MIKLIISAFSLWISATSLFAGEINGTSTTLFKVSNKGDTIVKISGIKLDLPIELDRSSLITINNKKLIITTDNSTETFPFSKSINKLLLNTPKIETDETLNIYLALTDPKTFFTAPKDVNLIESVTLTAQHGVIAAIWNKKDEAGYHVVGLDINQQKIMWDFKVETDDLGELLWLNDDKLLAVFRGRKGSGGSIIDLKKKEVVEKFSGSNIRFKIRNGEVFKEDIGSNNKK